MDNLSLPKHGMLNLKNPDLSAGQVYFRVCVRDSDICYNFSEVSGSEILGRGPFDKCQVRSCHSEPFAKAIAYAGLRDAVQRTPSEK